ncbi:hypothetical protein MKX08_006668 [Trichoderma sp. CBMAI-0020]|nr:hypothetical protein MKX08_006668 [Trichoderma sp. CBMAI-0020]
MFNLNKLLVKVIKTRKSVTEDMGRLIKRQPPPMAYFIDFENTIDTETKKVSFAATRLEGTALKWFRPVWDVYLDNPTGPWPAYVDEIFTNFSKFEEELVKAFGDVGEVRMAENKLSEIYQKGRCFDYAVKFRDLASRVTWG